MNVISQADLDWQELSAILQGPRDAPQSREEALSQARASVAAIDEKGTAFIKNYPDDSRRWQVILALAASQQVRETVGLPAWSRDKTSQQLEAVMNAPEVPETFKVQASFLRASYLSGGDETAFRQAVAEHLKKYPTFPANSRLADEIKRLDKQKVLSEKPLDLKFTAVDGSKVDLAALKGKVVLIDFWATWCEPCIRRVPVVVATYQRFHGRGFEIIGISLDESKADLLNVTKVKQMSWKQYFDGQVWQNKYARQFEIDSIPRMWLINRKGKIVDFDVGDDLPGKVERLLVE